MSYVSLDDLAGAPRARLVGGGRIDVRVMPAGSYAIRSERQATAFSCGAAALAAVIRQRGGLATEANLIPQLGTTHGGTRPSAMARVARLHGLSAEVRTGVPDDDLYDAIEDGVSVILDVQHWEDDEAPRKPCEDAHFVILAGVTHDDVFIVDPSAGELAWMPVDDLVDRWKARPWPGEEPCAERVAVLVSGGKDPVRTTSPIVVATRFF